MSMWFARSRKEFEKRERELILRSFEIISGELAMPT